MAIDAIGVALVLGGVALFIIEMVHPGAFLLIPGTVLLLGGVLYILTPDFLLYTVGGPLIVVAAAVFAAVISVPIYRRLAPVHRPMVTIPTSLVGRTGIVKVPVIPDSLSGKVQVDSEVWSARAGVTIPVGARVRIVGGEGVCVIVQPVEGSN